MFKRIEIGEFLGIYPLLIKREDEILKFTVCLVTRAKTPCCFSAYCTPLSTLPFNEMAKVITFAMALKITCVLCVKVAPLVSLYQHLHLLDLMQK